MFSSCRGGDYAALGQREQQAEKPEKQADAEEVTGDPGGTEGRRSQVGRAPPCRQTAATRMGYPAQNRLSKCPMMASTIWAMWCSVPTTDSPVSPSGWPNAMSKVKLIR